MTATETLDAAIAELSGGVAKWARLPLAARADLLERTQASVADHAEEWATTAIRAKGTPAGQLEGEEWMSGPYAAVEILGTYVLSLRAMAAGRSPLSGLKFGTAPGGRTTVQVLPTDLKASVLLNGFIGEVWLPPGVSASQASANAGLGARNVGENGGVGLVLGAGNISAIGPLDVLYELVAFNRASVLKVNPTFASLKPVYERALAPLVQFGLLRVVSGGAETGGYLAQHPDISHVHITGSAVTHDAIVWGTGAEAARHREANDPKLTKPISSELGGVSPIIVVPGTWSKGELRFQAEHVATQRLHNGGHNCIAGQALIVSADWPQREEFLAELRRVLDELPRRDPWYPGTDGKLAAARTSYPSAEDHGGRLLVATDADADEDLFTTEYFGPVLGHTALPGTGAAFLRAAVAFANDRLDGTLGASLIVHPRDRKAMGTAFDEAIADLRYGGVGVNVWSAIVFLLPGAVWGAYPGNTLESVGSGIGVVHNGFLIDGAEKTVVTGPFHPFPASVLSGEFTLAPRPPWFVTARTAAASGRALTAFGAKRSWGRLAKVLPPAMLG